MAEQLSVVLVRSNVDVERKLFIEACSGDWEEHRARRAPLDDPERGPDVVHRALLINEQVSALLVDLIHDKCNDVGRSYKHCFYQLVWVGAVEGAREVQYDKTVRAILVDGVCDMPMRCYGPA